jgi:hypothetical protein
MSYQVAIADLKSEKWSIALATHLNTSIPNETCGSALKISGYRARAEKRYSELFHYKRVLEPIAGYNCFGQVFALRRTGLYEDLDLDAILSEDGFGAVADDDHLLVGDVLAHQHTLQQEREKHGCKVGHTTYSCPEGVRPTEEFHCDERYPEAPQPP